MLTFYLFQISEVILILLIIGVVVIFPVAIIGIIFHIFYRNKRTLKAWESLASKLNFQMPNRTKFNIFGDFNGCQIKVGVRTEHRRTENGNRVKFFTHCTAEFPQPLRFLLKINSPRESFSRIIDSTNVKLGNAAFDKSFDAKCYDPDILRRLLMSDFPSDKTQNLLGDLMWVKQSNGTISVTDKGVYLERKGQIRNEDLLRQMIEGAAHLGKRFEAARQSFPLADWEKNLISSWQNFANQNGLVFNARYFQIQGIYNGAPIFIELETDSEKWETRIKLKFPQNLAIGFKLMPENSVHKAFTWLGVQDIETGIKPFDDAFIVKANNVEAAKWKLQPDLCSKLLGINNNASTTSIDDNEFSVTYNTVLGDSQLLKETLDAVTSASRMLMR